jgi:hypothetical protein
MNILIAGETVIDMSFEYITGLLFPLKPDGIMVAEIVDGMLEKRFFFQ